MKGKISVIIPVYNKGSVLFNTLTKIIASLRKLTSDFEIIIVNDGSKDNTLTQAKKLRTFNGNRDNIKIYHNPLNNGKGYALKYGFLRSTGDKIVFFDGDLDIDSSHINHFINLLEQNHSDIIIGSKYHPYSRVSYPLNRYLYSIILKFIIRILFNIRVSDTQVGLKAFKREVLARTIPLLIVKRFAFDVELLVVANMYGFSNIIEAPVVINHNKITSTIDLWEVKNFLIDILAIFYRKNILRFYSPLSESPISARENGIRRVIPT